MKNKKFGFTLGEILIALSVIGVVATLILPMLINNRKAAEARARFDTAHSIITQAFAQMEVEGVPVLPTSYTASQSLYAAVKPYFKVTIDCGDFTSSVKNDTVCINRSSANGGSNEKDNYLTYYKDPTISANIARFDDGAFVANNGMLYMFENSGDADGYIWITVDINGKNKLPNRWGWDVFTFELTKNGILPLGAPETTELYSSNPSAYCDNTSSNSENGATCSYFAATDMDYFKTLYKSH
jgi:prepilin-type N-terminal cleavage/methylation domain-containing protein